MSADPLHAVCLLPAYPWVRPPQWRRTVNQFDKPEDDRRTYLQAGERNIAALRTVSSGYQRNAGACA